MVQHSAPPTARRTLPERAASVIWKPATSAAGIGLAALVIGLAAESEIIRAAHGNRLALEWLSDALISMALAAIAYLWLHLRATRTRVLALEREQIVIGEQLRLAAEIQQNLLPEVPRATPGFRWAARMMPAGLIGGDFYDFVTTKDGTVLAMLGDASGKGIPAALVMSSLKTLFRNIVRETVDPASIAERMAAALHEEHAGSPYATGIITRFEAAPSRLAYVNAGHPAGYLLRNGTAVIALESGGPPFGLLAGTTYATTDVELQPGDIGVLVTDGVTEALEDGPTTLMGLLSRSPRGADAEGLPAEICEQLLSAAASGPGPTGAPDWQDDRTVFVFGVQPAR